MKTVSFSVLFIAFLIQLDHICQADVHTCVHISNKLLKAGSGTTEDSCMGCNPALETCYPGCQSLIDKLYTNCDNVCLPYGFYFDPQQQLEGCWSANKANIKIKVERCGCNSAFSSRTFYSVFSFPCILLCIVLIILFIK